MSESVGRILVTGATGTVGSAVIKAISDTGYKGEIRCATRRPDVVNAPLAENVATVAFDFSDLNTVKTAVEDVDVLFLATGYTIDMLVQSKTVLDAAKSAGVSHVVHLGALAPNDTILAPPSWHQLVESYIETLGFSYSHLRPNFFMNTILDSVDRTKGRLFHFFGDARLSCVHVDDIAAVAAAALTDPAMHADKIYPLATDAMTLTEVAAVLSNSWKTDVTCIARPVDEFLPILLKNGMEYCYAAGLAAQTQAVAEHRAPLSDTVFSTVDDVLGRPSITWTDAAVMHM